MAERKDGGRGASGTAGGTDVEPLRGGMAEEDRKQGLVGAGPATAKEPAAPYHRLAVPQGGLAPRGEPSPHGGGATPREGTPPDPGEAGESAARPEDKIEQERREHEREGAVAPRREPR